MAPFRVIGHAIADTILRSDRPSAVDFDQLRNRSRTTTVALVTAPLVLTIWYYFGVAGPLRLPAYLVALGFDQPAADLRAWFFDSPSASLNRNLLFGAMSVFVFLILPAAVVRWILREPFSAFGVRLRGTLEGFAVSAVLFALMLPIYVLLSFTETFQSQYPLYKPPSGEPLGSVFYCWQLLYGLQFVSVEFFFRGFLLHGTRLSLGSSSVLVMTIPYCMIHFGKPILETAASIPTGIVLGLLSLRYRSIWPGLAVHLGLAWAMEILTGWQTGLWGF